MPFINSKVNVPMTKEQETSIKTKLGKAISLIPGKSETWLMIGFENEATLYFKGDGDSKIAFIEVKLFGKASSQAYENLTKEICNIYEEVLGIQQDKIYVKYEEVNNWGWNGSNF